MLPVHPESRGNMADEGITGKADEYDIVCCCLQVPKEMERTVTSDQIEMGAETFVDMDVFVSAMPSAPAGNNIVEDFGLITMVVAKHRFTFQGNVGIQKILERDMAEAERARALALAKLRSKAKSIGANAVLAIKLDAEESKYGATFIHVMGNAVRLSVPAGSSQWSQSRPPPYLPFSIER
jgi:uncharacterized protein YbjQ (UPF0145 family)